MKCPFSTTEKSKREGAQLLNYILVLVTLRTLIFEFCVNIDVALKLFVMIVKTDMSVKTSKLKIFVVKKYFFECVPQFEVFSLHHLFYLFYFSQTILLQLAYLLLFYIMSFCIFVSIPILV